MGLILEEAIFASNRKKSLLGAKFSNKLGVQFGFKMLGCSKRNDCAILCVCCVCLLYDCANSNSIILFVELAQSLHIVSLHLKESNQLLCALVFVVTFL